MPGSTVVVVAKLKQRVNLTLQCNSSHFFVTLLSRLFTFDFTIFLPLMECFFTNFSSPWRIVDDCGGAFTMGAIGGAVFQSIKGFRNAPSVS